MYNAHYALTDDLITHLDPILGALKDPFIESRYTGFLAVSAVTVFELAIKDIFVEFADRKHKVLGSFTQAYFKRVNGRIALQVLKDEYVRRFGDKYYERFQKRLKSQEALTLRVERTSMQQCYANLLAWRHEFAHAGRVPTHATYDEVKRSYQIGKGVIDCLAGCMRR